MVLYKYWKYFQVKLLLYVVWLLNLVVYLRLASKWSKLMQNWCEVDAAMQKAYIYPPNLDYRFKIMVAIYIAIIAGIIYD